MSSYRDLGLRFDVALAGLSMAQVLPVALPAVREAVEEAESIAQELGATAVLGLLAEATARGPERSPRRKSAGQPLPSPEVPA
jgi:ferric-dicitrate binding protein FerR (iron transport regulator)